MVTVSSFTIFLLEKQNDCFGENVSKWGDFMLKKCPWGQKNKLYSKGLLQVFLTHLILILFYYDNNNNILSHFASQLNASWFRQRQNTK